MTKEQRSEYNRQWYLANATAVKAKVVERSKAYRKRNVAHVQALKARTPCTDCGVQYPFYVMQFDHLGDKQWNISELALKGGSLRALDAEIAKCEIVCANCHAERSWSRSPFSDR